MTIMYPIDKPVTADDLRARLAELREQGDELTPWQTTVVDLLAKNADAVHAHYMTHVWYENPDQGPPEPHKARSQVRHAIETALASIDLRHAGEAHLGDHEHPDDPIMIGDMDARMLVDRLVTAAAMIVDDVMESLRRGECAITDGRAHGIDMDEWSERMDETAWWTDRTGEPDVTAPDVDRVTRMIGDGIAAHAGDETRGHSLEQGRQDAKFAKARRLTVQTKRNRERIEAAIALTNENMRLPKGYRLKLQEIKGTRIRLTWGRKPDAHEKGGMRELVTRPSGEETVFHDTMSLGETHPRVIADIAKAGRFVAMVLGRDAEIRAAGHELSQPPIWAWAGPLPLVRHTLARLQSGEDVDMAARGMRVGPLMSTDGIDLGDGQATYTYNVRTLDETLDLELRLPDTLAYGCVGNPVSVIVQSPLFDDDRVTIQSCETGEDGTEIEILSPIVRLAAAPGNIPQDPEEAWMARLADFDEAKVYGRRLWAKTEAPTHVAR